MPQISHITSCPVDYTHRKSSASLSNLPSLRAFLLVAYFEVLFGGFHFASDMRGKGKLECDHGLKLTRGVMLWLNKTLINGLNFKWATNKTVSHAPVEVCALGVWLNYDIMALFSEGRKIATNQDVLEKSSRKEGFMVSLKWIPNLKISMTSIQTQFFSFFPKLADQWQDQKTVRDPKAAKFCSSGFMQQRCLCCCGT